jgi:hypothetical protein
MGSSPNLPRESGFCDAGIFAKATATVILLDELVIE